MQFAAQLVGWHDRNAHYRRAHRVVPHVDGRGPHRTRGPGSMGREETARALRRAGELR
ncbi:MAG TPA: hypothetical protein VF043_12700 [Ktedonobacteraceae bacterium]